MTHSNKIEQILRGKTVRIFSARADKNTVSFVETYRNCGKKSCVRCRDKEARPHGPYWNLNYSDENGKLQSLYIGRKLPSFAHNHHKVSFADVARYYTENENQKKSISRYQEEVRQLKTELIRLFEELRILRRRSTKKTSVRAERFFRNLVLKYHPDRNAARRFDAEDVMKDINQLRALHINDQ